MPNIFLEIKAQMAYKQTLFEKTRTMVSIIHCFLIPSYLKNPIHITELTSPNQWDAQHLV